MIPGHLGSMHSVQRLLSCCQQRLPLFLLYMSDHQWYMRRFPERSLLASYFAPPIAFFPIQGTMASCTRAYPRTARCIIPDLLSSTLPMLGNEPSPQLPPAPSATLGRTRQVLYIRQPMSGSEPWKRRRSQPRTQRLPIPIVRWHICPASAISEPAAAALTALRTCRCCRRQSEFFAPLELRTADIVVPTTSPDPTAHGHFWEDVGTGAKCCDIKSRS
jgi:hypothetical protein